MGKTKIALIIILLLIVSALLMVTLFSEEDSEAVISSNQMESEQPNSQPQQAKPASQDVIIDEEAVESDVNQSLVQKSNDTADDSVNAPNEESPPSGVDIKTNHEQMTEQFESEEMDYHWSGYWQNELQTIVLFVGAKAFVENTEVECKSSTCEVSVKLSVNGPQNTVEAVGALSDEFAQRGLKFVPASIDPDNGEIVFYTQPGGIPE